VYNPTRFHENRFRTSRIILYTITRNYTIAQLRWLHYPPGPVIDISQCASFHLRLKTFLFSKSFPL